MEKVDKERQLRVRIHSYQRQKKVRGMPCPWCDASGNRVHHIIPIQFGGSYGEYNLMSCCQTSICGSHSRLNRLSNHWVKIHAKKHGDKTLLEKTRLCKEYVLDCVRRAKAERAKRSLLKEKPVEDRSDPKGFSVLVDYLMKEEGKSNGNVQSDVHGGSEQNGFPGQQAQEDVLGGRDQDAGREGAEGPDVEG